MWLGIDLGTTNSCVYRMGNTTGDVVPSPLGSTLTPSVVSVGPHEVVCGDMTQGTNPKYTFFGFKRTIGRKYKDKQLWSSAVEWPFTVSRPKHEDDEPVYTAPLDGEMVQLTPRDLYVHLLRYMLQEVVIKDIKIVAITVPAHFNTVQRDATKDAVSRAGVPLNKMRIINEPTAAVVAFLDDHPEIRTGRLLVVDVGGGTVDCTLVEVQGTKSVVLESKGSSEVGGEVITDILVSKKKPKGLSKDHIGEFRATIEEMKKQLSLRQEVTVGDMTITRDELDMAAEPTVTAVCDLAATVGGRENELTAIVLCGGTTRMPTLRKRLAEVYPEAIVSTELNPLTAVARGAAIFAKGNTTLPGTIPNVQDILTSSVGLRVREDDMYAMAEAGFMLPLTTTKLYKPMYDDQEYTEVVICQGNHHLASHNVELGRFRLGPCPHWVTVAVNSSGTVDITAKQSENNEQVLMKRVKIWNM
jgi:molecular chaperone DnaK